MSAIFSDGRQAKTSSGVDSRDLEDSVSCAGADLQRVVCANWRSAGKSTSAAPPMQSCGLTDALRHLQGPGHYPACRVFD